MRDTFLKRRWVSGLALALVSSGLAGVAQAAPPTDAEQAAFAQKLEAAVAARDGAAYAALWNVDALCDRVTANVDAPPLLKNGFISGLKPNFAQSLGTSLVDAAGTSGGAKYLGLVKIDGATRPVMRIIGTNGLNYHELVLEPDTAGDLKIIDMYVYASGEMLGDTLRRMYITAVMQPGQGDKMPAGFEEMSAMGQQVKTGDFKGALVTFDTMPPEGRKLRMVQLFRIMAAAQVDPVLHEQLLDEYVKLFGGDVTADLMSIDSYFLKKKYADCNAALDRVEKRVGRDPYLDVYRANLCAVQNDTPGAKKFAEKALADEPGLFEAHDILLTRALEAKDFPTCTTHLLAIEKYNPNFRFGDLKGVPLFAPYVASPEYAKWVKARAAL